MDSKKIYTYKYEPFMMGGNLHRPIATEVEDYEVINFGKGYTALLVKNPVKEKWHICLDGCGAMIGTDEDKETLVARVTEDIAGGDEEIMKDQIAQGMSELKNAEVIDNDRFFGMFKD